MRVALIGGAGFVGHHLALNLKYAGHYPVVIDSLSVNNIYAIQNDWFRYNVALERIEEIEDADIHLLRMDARDYGQLSQTLRFAKPDAIIHLAAVAHQLESNKNPYSTFDHSLRTLENALDCARALNTPHFIYFSSSTVYGDFDQDPMPEDSVCRPKSVYASVKLAGELLVKGYACASDFPYTIVRPSALYGSGCISGRVVQTFIERAMLDQPLVIKGSGKARHDFTHINDLVSGITGLLAHGPVKDTINMTRGNARSLAELAGIVSSFFPDSQVKIGREDKSMPRRGSLDISKAKNLFGYNPTVDLEEGVADYIGWYKELRYGESMEAA